MQNFGICVPFWNEIAHYWSTNNTSDEHVAKLHSNWMKNTTLKF